jgi:hypothetical protein
MMGIFITFGFAEGTSVRQNERKCFFFRFCAHLFVPLQAEKSRPKIASSNG